MLNDYPDVLTVSDVQKILRIGKNRAYELVKQNKIPSIRIGNTYRISRNAIEDILCYNTYAESGRESG